LKQKSSHRGKTTNTKDDFIDRYGEENGIKRYNEFCSKLKKSNKNINTLDYYEKKYGDDGKRMYEEKNKKISDKGRGTLKNFQDRYGEEEGIQRHTQYIEKQKKSHSLEGYIEKYGEEGAQKWEERVYCLKHNGSLEGFKKRYGEEEGLQKWHERQRKWLKSYKKSNFSKVSQKLFWQLYEKLKTLYNDIYFAELNVNNEDMSGRNHEYILELKKSHCKLDFFIKDINKCIEFDGDYWHGEKAGNQKNDLERDKRIKEMNINVLHIKERDFNNAPEMVINKCLEFINE
jgi:hypothetical protein